ncbi:hypothetical protein L1987_06156 [Smallanthus sonchifolius]|uniref:Uncharacterized protein n=1 Tax=Smallanthus sonchifolius TaxID=185202 RepID=A0ACB9JXH3_9ASTR|nr:hypothetical protein L1987_06156 [Smallanthus sonchifolius]
MENLTMLEQVDYDYSLLESISNYLLDDHSESFINDHNHVGFPVFDSNDLNFPAISEESSINIDQNMSSIFMDDPIWSLSNLDDFEISSLLQYSNGTDNMVACGGEGSEAAALGEVHGGDEESREERREIMAWNL